MTKQQNKGYYVCMILCDIFEFLAIIGAYAAHYFTKTRMGMLRHVVYLNGKWEKAVSIPTVKWIMLLIIIALIVLVYLHYRKRKMHNMSTTIAALITIAISGWTVYFLLFYNTGRNRAYYIISICFILVTVLQNILYYCLSAIKTTN